MPSITDFNMFISVRMTHDSGASRLPSDAHNDLFFSSCMSLFLSFFCLNFLRHKNSSSIFLLWPYGPEVGQTGMRQSKREACKLNHCQRHCFIMYSRNNPDSLFSPHIHAAVKQKWIMWAFLSISECEESEQQGEMGFSASVVILAHFRDL